MAIDKSSGGVLKELQIYNASSKKPERSHPMFHRGSLQYPSYVKAARFETDRTPADEKAKWRLSTDDAKVSPLYTLHCAAALTSSLRASL